jgi:hypothetical protein
MFSWIVFLVDEEPLGSLITDSTIASKSPPPRKPPAQGLPKLPPRPAAKVVTGPSADPKGTVKNRLQFYTSRKVHFIQPEKKQAKNRSEFLMLLSANKATMAATSEGVRLRMHSLPSTCSTITHVHVLTMLL